MKSCIPRFNSQRMVVDYVSQFYAKARQQSVRLGRDNAQPARELATWKSKIRKSWSNVTIKRTDSIEEQIHNSSSLPIRISTYLDGLDPDDVTVECLVGVLRESGNFAVTEKFAFTYTGMDADQHLFELDLKPDTAGLNHYKIRIYPYHELLSHPFELGFMLWV